MRALAPVLFCAVSAFALIPGFGLCGRARRRDPTDAETSQTPPTVQEVVVTARKLDAARETIEPALGSSQYTLTSQAISALPSGDNSTPQSGGAADAWRGAGLLRPAARARRPRQHPVPHRQRHPARGPERLRPGPHPALCAERRTWSPARCRPSTAWSPRPSSTSRPRAASTTKARSRSTAAATTGSSRASSMAGSSGANNWFVTGSYTADALGIESPDGSADPHHDRTEQYQAFGFFDHIIDPQSRVSVIGGISDETFQIPQAGGQPFQRHRLRGRQRRSAERERRLRLSQPGSERDPARGDRLRHRHLPEHTTEAFTGQLSLFGRYSTPDFHPDVLGDLLFQRRLPGGAQDRRRGGGPGRGRLQPRPAAHPALRRHPPARPLDQRHHLGGPAGGRQWRADQPTFPKPSSTMARATPRATAPICRTSGSRSNG